MFLEDSCERFRDAFDVGKDCKVTSVYWLSPFKEHTDHSSGVGVGGGDLVFTYTRRVGRYVL